MPRNSYPFSSAESGTGNKDGERFNAVMKKKSKEERLREARARAKAWHYGYKLSPDYKNDRRYSAGGTIQTCSDYPRQKKEQRTAKADNFYYDGHQQDHSTKPVTKKKNSKQRRLSDARARARAWSEGRKSFGTTMNSPAAQKKPAPVERTSPSLRRAHACKEERNQRSTSGREFGPTGTPVKKKKAPAYPRRDEIPYLTAEMEVEEMEIDEIWFDAREVSEVEKKAKARKESKAERRRVARERATKWAAERKSIG